MPNDDVDEELMAMAAPSPSLRYGLFIVVVLGLLVTMLVWFYPEFEYAIQVGKDPVDLGEASELDLNKLESNTYVSLDGIPHVTKGIEFKEGVRWFAMSDNARHFNPLTGQPNVYVQWKESEEYKAYRDPKTNPTKPGPPSHYEGHLLKREDLIGTNYDRILVFYDCLKVHPLRRCNRCLGKSDMDLCRELFTCAEAHNPEDCVPLVQHITDPGSVDVKDVKIPLRGHRVEVALMRVEELAVKASRLDGRPELTDEEKMTLDGVKREILDIQIAELKARAAPALKQSENLTAEQQSSLRATIAEIEKTEDQKKWREERQVVLSKYFDVAQALEHLKIRIGKVKKPLVDSTDISLAELGEWKLDPASDNSKQIAEELYRLETVVFGQVKKEQQEAKETEGATDSETASEEEQTETQFEPQGGGPSQPAPPGGGP